MQKVVRVMVIVYPSNNYIGIYVYDILELASKQYYPEHDFVNNFFKTIISKEYGYIFCINLQTLSIYLSTKYASIVQYADVI